MFFFFYLFVVAFVCLSLGDIIEISDPRPSSSSSPQAAGGSLLQPEAVPCKDGGCMIDPSTSPIRIRSFTRLQDLDPDQRAAFQNQFQKKSRRSSLNKGGMATWPDQFDELMNTGTTCTNAAGTNELCHTTNSILVSIRVYEVQFKY